MRGSATYVIGRLRGEFRPASTVLKKGISVIASQSAGESLKCGFTSGQATVFISLSAAWKS